MTTTPEELFDLLKYNITTASNGTTIYQLNGEVHRDEDQPAVIGVDGSKYWFQNGTRHRDNQPAVIKANGSEYWFRNGKLIKSEQS